MNRTTAIGMATVLFGAMAAVAAGTAAAPDKAKLEGLKKTVRENNAAFSCWCPYYCAVNYGAGAEASGKGDKPAEMLAKCLAAYKEYLALVPGDNGMRFGYAEALKVSGAWDAALAEYAVLAKAKLGDYDRSRLAFATADAQIGKGDRAGAIETLRAFVALKIHPRGGRGADDYANICETALEYLEDRALDDMRMPRYTGAKPFPEPQEAEYAEEFVPLKDVKIALSGLDADDARVKLLRVKLDRLGVANDVKGMLGFLSGGWTLRIAVTPEAPVDKPEGYSLTVTKDGAEILARDAQGALWGVVSFIQSIDWQKKAVRCLKVRDWPVGRERGFLSTGLWRNLTEYVLFQKMNSVDLQSGGASNPRCHGKLSPLRLYIDTETTRQFRAFGLDLYFGINWATQDLNGPCTGDWLVAYQAKVCKVYAKMGAGVYYPNDDCRYPINEEDAKTGKNASDFDAPHILKMYNLVKQEYPDFKLIYCPPFYWGPDSNAKYPDDREKYLKSLRILPPEVQLYWTGGQVKGYDKHEYQVKWFTELTGHKPTIFQNGTGAHNLLNYVIDETDWAGWHYDGFLDDIVSFHKNSHVPTETPQITTLADWLWNPKGYDKARSARRGPCQMMGEGIYDILKPGLAALAYFDKYRYGALNADILHEDLKDLQAKYELARGCWEKAQAYAKEEGVSIYAHYGQAIGYAERVIKGAKNPPDFMARYKDKIGPARELAEKDTKFDKSKGDLLFLPTDMTGPQMDVYNHPMIKEKRFVKYLRAVETPFSATTFKFECDPFPPAGDYRLFLYGMDDEVKGLNPIEIAVNGTVVFSGEPGFPEKAYALKEFKVPFASMKRYNTLSIRNLAKGANPNGPPYIALAYAVLKKAK